VPSIGTIGNYGEEMPNGVEIIELEARLTFQFPVVADIVGEA
jgi:hypothetical protein